MMDRICKDGCDRKHSEFGVTFLRRDVDRIGRNDLADLRYIRKTLQPATGEDSMCAYYHDLAHAFINQHAAQFQNGTSCGNLIVIDQGPFMSLNLVAHQSADLYF